MNKTIQKTFETQLCELHRGNKVYSKRVDSPTEAKILSELKNGKAKLRKSFVKGEYGVGAYFILPCHEEHKKAEKKAEAVAENANKLFDLAFYKANDDLTMCGDATKGLKIVENFRRIAEKHRALHKRN